MARTLSTPGPGAILPEGAREFLARRLCELAGAALVTAAAALGAALIGYASTDPSFNNATGAAPANPLGLWGAGVADLILQGVGLAGILMPVAFGVWGMQLLRKRPPGLVVLRALLLVIAVPAAALAAAAWPAPGNWPLLSGLGGAAGGLALPALAGTLDGWLPGWGGSLAGGGFGFIAVFSFVGCLGLAWRDWRAGGGLAGGLCLAVANGAARAGRWLAAGAGALWWRIAAHRHRPAAPPRARPERVPTALKDVAAGGAAKPRVTIRKPALKEGPGARARRQVELDLEPGTAYQLPPHALLDAPKGKSQAVGGQALEQNARLLESVLEDFGVRGEIINVRPGPVVTLYELEPAPGTKTARVIGLSDDIARSMSAISVRVAVVPGRNVIGIELPNASSEMVYLREMLTSADFEKAKGGLNLALGKDIGGAPVVVDLARMPHLLIAGTTGSGKSVGINTMILSLLYQMEPDACKFIMIDPKMLELSVYDGIPHLLTPVVTESRKAVVALKWAVREMEDRYRAMSQLGVRNIAGYNARIAEALKKGEELTRVVQTGFDEMGQPVYENQPLGMEPLPFIVVVVDEMADLMLVAGKDVEAAIQRLAQMARAAGIHLIMATQRPSVDVITGTIKANFPTRISFQVTSKIDSRTILGEQGAEHLLGQGDMLYMAGGGRITRVHGPFVSDAEVEDVVRFLKAQSQPSYVSAVTEDPDDDEAPLLGCPGSPSGDDLYDQAVAVIAREGKASTSFIQRHLQIGYNRAARIIERMEKEGVVGKANRTGKREILISNTDDLVG